MYKFKIDLHTLDPDQRKEEKRRLEKELESICSYIKIIPYNNVLTVNVSPINPSDIAQFIDDLSAIIQTYPDYSEIEHVN